MVKGVETYPTPMLGVNRVTKSDLVPDAVERTLLLYSSATENPGNAYHPACAEAGSGRAARSTTATATANPTGSRLTGVRSCLRLYHTGGSSSKPLQVARTSRREGDSADPVGPKGVSFCAKCFVLTRDTP